MGWISKRAFRRGTSLYDGGPKRKGPLKKIISFTNFDNDFFGSSSGWLECGHHSSGIYGEKKAICEKCRLEKPIDIKGEDGWPRNIG